MGCMLVSLFWNGLVGGGDSDCSSPPPSFSLCQSPSITHSTSSSSVNPSSTLSDHQRFMASCPRFAVLAIFNHDFQLLTIQAFNQEAPITTLINSGTVYKVITKK